MSGKRSDHQVDVIKRPSALSGGFFFARLSFFVIRSFRNKSKIAALQGKIPAFKNAWNEG
jgi:hypothetical protein